MKRSMILFISFLLITRSYGQLVSPGLNCSIPVNGQTITDPIPVLPPVPIIINSTVIQKECNRLRLGSITITASSAATATLTYTLDNKLTNSTGIFNNQAPGTHNIKISSSTGDDKDTVVTVPDYYSNRPTTTYVANLPFCDITGSVKFTVKDNSNGHYKIGIGDNVYGSDQEITGFLSGVYNFAILNADGCAADSVSVVLIRKPCTAITFPTTFTPNHDGVNDIFRASQTSTAKTFEMRIYNRNGWLLFTSQSVHTGWDGTYQNKNVPIGAYFWIVNFSYIDGKPITQAGTVALIR